ncbi:ECF transporter S component [Bacteroidaceae bacterium HV4-6-C5C]|jgi:hypothetical protein|nr:ECF transporter S component [Bacteroidaceae bacterium HV4-6-C5C]
MENSAKFYSLSFTNSRTWLFAGLFVIGNILFPQLCHLLPVGGPTLLPIYFFTLIAGYKFGLKVGLLTAICSPIINHILFGMPPSAVLPAILIKSLVLAGISAIVALRIQKVSFPAILVIVLTYQIVGTAFEWIISGSLYAAAQDFRIGIPGMLIQWIGGYALLKLLAKA